MTEPCESKVYYALALDPIHVGMGGYRLGRVDLSIVREPGTNLPKIPGTSLSGVTRAYAAMATGRYRWDGGRRLGDEAPIEGSCAGQGQASGNTAGHCGSPYCPVCVAFGFARGGGGSAGEEGSGATAGSSSGFAGLAQFADARILFFPVHSMLGPVWVTSPMSLREREIEVKDPGEEVCLGSGLESAAESVNLGWLMLQKKKGGLEALDGLSDVPPVIRGRAVLVSDKLFGQIVNDNLEVRTSVSIDPRSGAAEEGALYTYEALPRGTVLWFPITYNDPGLYRIRHEGQLVRPEPHEMADPQKPELCVKQTVEKGLALLRELGVGGMNTRGMGRLKVLNLDDKPAEAPAAASAPSGDTGATP